MSFGFVDAPSCPMYLMNTVLRPTIDRCVEVFSDDILIYNPEEQQHVYNLTEVLLLLRTAKPKEKLSKCEFFV